MQTRSSLLVLVALGACTSYAPSLPAAPFYCGSADPKCPDGYACMQSASGGSAVCGTQMETCATPYTGMLATWTFTGAAGSQASTPGTANAPGVTAASITRSAALMASTGSDSINASNWPTGAQLDPASYYTISITAPASCDLDVTGMMIDVKSSSTGPASAAVATSADAFAHIVMVSTTVPSTATLSATAGSVEIRIYGYGATGASGTMRVENTLTVTGALN